MSQHGFQMGDEEAAAEESGKDQILKIITAIIIV